jgi:riboflavin-specific deaminase-like protein
MVQEMELIERILSEIETDNPPERPRVTLSYAQSLDGSIAFCRGKPLGLSGSHSQQMTHQLRAAHDAILVGIGTVLADNPRLTVRLAVGNNPQPVILDSQLRFPLQANLLRDQGKAGCRSPWIATTERGEPHTADALEAAGAQVLKFAASPEGRVPLQGLLERLASFGVRSLMVEGGARVITSFLSAGLADSFVLTMAPLFVGGLHAVEHLAVSGRSHLYSKARELNAGSLGKDLIVWGKFA